MPQIIECEEKFFCNHTPTLFHFIEKELGFHFQKKVFETDTYFKDKNNKYIQPDTCLRLRKSDSQLLELTSKKILHKDERIKIEKTYTFSSQKKERILSLLKRIGITPYCTVFKERFVYTLEKENLLYSVMIDIINEKTSFLELEIVANTNDINLEQKLNNFVALFQNFNLKKTSQNYRDFTIETQFKKN